MKRKVLAGLVLFFQIDVSAAWAQLRAGTPEAKMFEQITGEKNPDSKIELITTFEKQFPQSKILPSVYLMAVEIYRDKNDRPRILEFGEKALQLDNTNITAMMLLATIPLKVRTWIVPLILLNGRSTEWQRCGGSPRRAGILATSGTTI